jgi:hypothetical protein
MMGACLGATCVAASSHESPFKGKPSTGKQHLQRMLLISTYDADEKKGVPLDEHSSTTMMGCTHHHIVAYRAGMRLKLLGQ